MQTHYLVKVCKNKDTATVIILSSCSGTVHVAGKLDTLHTAVNVLFWLGTVLQAHFVFKKRTIDILTVHTRNLNVI